MIKGSKRPGASDLSASIKTNLLKVFDEKRDSLLRLSFDLDTN